MKIIADANIPFVAECFSSIGEVITVGGREITLGVVGDVAYDGEHLYFGVVLSQFSFDKEQRVFCLFYK